MFLLMVIMASLTSEGTLGRLLEASTQVRVEIACIKRTLASRSLVRSSSFTLGTNLRWHSWANAWGSSFSLVAHFGKSFLKISAHFSCSAELPNSKFGSEDIGVLSALPMFSSMGISLVRVRRMLSILHMSSSLDPFRRKFLLPEPSFSVVL